MINLRGLTEQQLDQLDTALAGMDEALEILIEREICKEDDALDILELVDAVAAEIEFREQLSA